jgi:hypothetical protein
VRILPHVQVAQTEGYGSHAVVGGGVGPQSAAVTQQPGTAGRVHVVGWTVRAMPQLPLQVARVVVIHPAVVVAQAFG